MKNLTKKEKYYVDLFESLKNNENRDSLFKVYKKPSDNKIRIFNHLIDKNFNNSIKRVRILTYNAQFFTLAIELQSGDLVIYTPSTTFYIENYMGVLKNEWF